ncbi:MAG: hypothetical protein HPY58_13525 [Firmicutes bacterium]|nr:hypothetical protein [Bacillota bacterium]
MTPSPELRQRLRKLLNEQIPAGGSDSDTNFLDAELDEILAEAANIWSAAAVGWTMKAGLLKSRIERYSVGQESYDLTALKDELDHALTMAQKYSDMAKASMGSVILRFAPPEVL